MPRKPKKPMPLIDHRRPEPQDEYYLDDDDPFCWTCNGRGYLIVCPDDLCHGQDFCIHGDGEESCPDCGGR